MPEKPAPLAPMLRKLEYWATLSDDDRVAILALPHILKTIEPEGYIVREGDKPTQCCLLRSGYVYRQKLVGDGARSILSIHMSGDLVDLQNSLLGSADHSVQALGHVDVAYIPRAAMRQIAFDRPAVGTALWYDTLVDGSIFREWLANIGRRNARTRIAHLLCEFALRMDAAGLGTRTRYELPMSQRDLADCTGLTSIHVNRTLRSMDADNLIVRTGRSVIIKNWKRLAEVGDFQSAYLHMNEDKLGLMR